jgi:hypothetical protein
MQNQQLPKEITTATSVQTQKRERLGKRWRDEVKEDLNIIEMKNRQAMV